MRKLWQPDDGLWFMDEDDDGSPAEGPETDEVVETPEEDVEPEMPDEVPPPAQSQSHGQSNEVVESLRAELRELKALVSEGKKNPAVDDDAIDPLERQMKELAGSIKALAEDREVEKKQAAQNQVVQLENAMVRDACAVMDQQAGQYRFLKDNAKLTSRIKRDVENTIRVAVRQNGLAAQQQITVPTVQFLFDRAAREFKEILDNSPAAKTGEAIAQANANKKAVDTSGGATPNPGDGQKKIEPGSDAWWELQNEQFKQKLDAAIRR